MGIKEVITRRMDDFHAHIRQTSLLRTVISFLIRQFGKVLVMPNTRPGIHDGRDASVYREQIEGEVSRQGGFLKPLMTIQLTTMTTAEIIRTAKRLGVIAAKLYPQGSTTNSGTGITVDYLLYSPLMRSVLQAMEEVGMVLCIHGEMPGEFVMDREQKFLNVLDKLVARYERLKIVLEHVSTEAAVNAVCSLPERVGATITPHHLTLTLDDVIGGDLKPHHFCKPVVKRPEDREALWVPIENGNGKFFLGTDLAGHGRGSKECGSGAAGVFMPFPGEYLVEQFEKRGYSEKLLEKFSSYSGSMFYGLPLNKEMVRYVRRPWIMEKQYGGIVPLHAGKEMKYQQVAS